MYNRLHIIVPVNTAVILWMYNRLRIIVPVNTARVLLWISLNVYTRLVICLHVRVLGFPRSEYACMCVFDPATTIIVSELQPTVG